MLPIASKKYSSLNGLLKEYKRPPNQRLKKKKKGNVPSLFPPENKQNPQNKTLQTKTLLTNVFPFLGLHPLVSPHLTGEFWTSVTAETAIAAMPPGIS